MSKEVRFVVLILWNGIWFIGLRMVFVLFVVFDMIKNDLNFLLDYNLIYDWRDSECDIGVMLRFMVDL